MADMTTETRPRPIKDETAFRAECEAMLDWLGTIEMPEDRVGIHEAGGNLGGILVGLMTASQANFYVAASSDVAALCGYLKNSVDHADRARILESVMRCAEAARDRGVDLVVDFQ